MPKGGAAYPHAHALSLLSASVEHGRDDHESSGDAALADSQSEANDEQTGKLEECQVVSDEMRLNM